MLNPIEDLFKTEQNSQFSVFNWCVVLSSLRNTGPKQFATVSQDHLCWVFKDG